MLPASIQSQALHLMSIRCFPPAVKPGPGPPRSPCPQLPHVLSRCSLGYPPPHTHTQCARLPLRGSGSPHLPTAASAANPSYPAKAAGVSGDSPEGQRLGGRNALTSSPRAPARHCWNTARRGLRRMFSVPKGAARANRPLSACAPTSAPHRPPPLNWHLQGRRNHGVEP